MYVHHVCIPCAYTMYVYCTGRLFPTLCARGCLPCTLLVRRYIHGDRREHNEHVDADAAVTVVVHLSHAGQLTYSLLTRRMAYYTYVLYFSFKVGLSDVADFTGGFFVGNGARRSFVRLGIGDAAVHTSEMLHGVHVTGNGSRCCCFQLPWALH